MEERCPALIPYGIVTKKRRLVIHSSLFMAVKAIYNKARDSHFSP